MLTAAAVADDCGVGGCQWTTGPWSACSVSVGLGSYTRAVQCRSGAGAGPVVANASLCAPPPPAAAQACELPFPGYLAGGWWNATFYPFYAAQVAQPWLSAPPLLPPGRQRVGMKLPFGHATADDPNPTDVRQAFYYAIPPDDTGVQALFWTGDANPNLHVRVTGMSFSKSSDNYYLSDEDVTLSAADGAQAGANAVVSLDCTPPVDTYGAAGIAGVSFVNAGHCSGVLEVFSFADLQATYLRPISVANASIAASANGSATVVPSVRYFRFFPPPGSTGVSLALSLDPGGSAASMDMFVSLYAKDGWPSPGGGRWSTVAQAPTTGGHGDVGKSIIVIDAEFVTDYYTIAVTCATPAAPCAGYILASGIIDLLPGQAVSATVPTLGTQYFRFSLSSDTDTVATVAAHAGLLDGDVGIFISAHPFLKPPRYFPSGPATSSSTTDAPGLSCPECEWRGFIAGVSLRSTAVTVNHLSLYWARTLWVAASCEVCVGEGRGRTVFPASPGHPPLSCCAGRCCDLLHLGRVVRDSGRRRDLRAPSAAPLLHVLPRLAARRCRRRARRVAGPHLQRARTPRTRPARQCRAPCRRCRAVLPRCRGLVRRSWRHGHHGGRAGRASPGLPRRLPRRAP